MDFMYVRIVYTHWLKTNDSFIAPFFYERNGST